MFTLPNLISILRIPLALIFLKQNMLLRLLSIALAMCSDFLDGFLARRFRQESLLGTLLDPLMDRFFVSFLLMILLFERALSFPQAIALLSREIAVVLFGCYLIYKKRLTTYRFRAIWTGKITTFFQFIVLLSITCGVKLADEWLIPFALLGILAMIELYTSRKEQIT